MQLARGDGQQRISSLRFEMPQGLLGMVSKVPLCGEPQAQLGRCPASSQIGHTTVEAGPGSFPLSIPEPGRPQAPIYLTSGYGGAPYGLSIVTPVLAGPFDLGTVITRARIEVNPTTSQITVTTDPLPQILDGVPTDLRTIEAVIDRPGIHLQPDRLRTAIVLRHGHRRAGRRAGGLEPVRDRRVPGTGVRAETLGVNKRRDQQSAGGEPDRQDRLPGPGRRR